jgi:glycerate kinase
VTSCERTSLRALACPASFKGVLPASAAADALAAGLREGGAQATALPIADGGEGTGEALHAALGGTWRQSEVSDPLGRRVVAGWLALPDGRAVVEAAAAIGLPRLTPAELDPLVASSRGFGELIAAALAEDARGLLLGLGGVATVDGGAGLREVLQSLPVPATVLCDVRTPLADAARLYGPQKGASPADVMVLAARLEQMDLLQPYAKLPGAGAAGGLGAALAALGATLVPGAEAILDAVAFDDRLHECDLVVTGEGTVDATTAEGKAPGVVARRCAAARVACVVAGGLVRAPVDGAETLSLSGDPSRCAEDLRDLGRALAER